MIAAPTVLQPLGRHNTGSCLNWGSFHSRVPFIRVPYYIKDLTRDPNLEKYPCRFSWKLETQEGPCKISEPGFGGLSYC